MNCLSLTYSVLALYPCFIKGKCSYCKNRFLLISVGTNIMCCVLRVPTQNDPDQPFIVTRRVFPSAFLSSLMLTVCLTWSFLILYYLTRTCFLIFNQKMLIQGVQVLTDGASSLVADCLMRALQSLVSQLNTVQRSTLPY